MREEKSRGLLTALAVFALTGAALGAPELAFDFSKGTEGVLLGKPVKARLGAGARLVKTPLGEAIESGPQGPAAVLPAPAKLWKAQGAIELRFSLSREVRYQKEVKPLDIPLIRCPALEVSLEEWPFCCRLVILRRGPKGAPKKKRNVFLGRQWLSHFKAGTGYSLVVTWNARWGQLEAYLNGVKQGKLRGAAGGVRWDNAFPKDTELQVGFTAGKGKLAVRTAVASVTMYPRFLQPRDVQALLKGRKVAPLSGEGRGPAPNDALDLAPYKLTPIYSADFSKPLRVIHEDKLFEGKKRVRVPKGDDWVLEGPGRAWTEKGTLWLKNEGYHVVLWNTRVFPENFLLEFGYVPEDSLRGLNIVFFAARPKAGGSIFDLALPKRAGRFVKYTRGPVNSYHTSYWATGSDRSKRETGNLRKNSGFFLVALGEDRIAGAGPGPHRVRILKDGGRLRLEVRGKIALAWDDDGKTYGPLRRDGYIGLRQMSHTGKGGYTSFKVWRVERK